MTAKGRHNPFGDSSKDFVFFPSLSHKKGVHRIVRGLESSCGLILLTGEIGIGKTSLSRYIQSYLADSFVFVELGNPYQTPQEQIFHCCELFGLDTEGFSSIHDCVGRLEKHFHTLLEKGKRPVIVFDESHLLTKRHLGLIHILSNLRAQDGPLVQILIVGQLEILDLLATEGMEALNQRIGVRCELSPLVLDDTDKYIHFKLEKSDKPQMATFSREAVEYIWRESGGLPRLINHVCAHALDALAFKDSNVVSPDMVDEVCQDSVYTGLFQARTRKRETARWPWIAGGLGMAVLAGVLAGMFLLRQGPDENMPPVVSGEPPRPLVEAPAEQQPAPAGIPVFEGRTSRQAVTPPPEPSGRTDPPADAGQAVPASGGTAGSGERAAATDSQGKAPVVVIDMSEISPPPDQGVAAGDESSPEGGDQEAIPVLSPDEAKDGGTHPLIGKLVIGAIAWNEDPAASIAVINSQITHEGEAIDGIHVVAIGEEYILFEYDNEIYKRTFSP
jgi:type II secretory pathway predicted ATPase ExeA